MKNSIYVSLLTSRIYREKVNVPALVHVYYKEVVNDDYDPDKSCNGGGYYQPEITLWMTIAKQKVKVRIDDSACGEFGRRYYVTVSYGETVLHGAVDAVGNDETESYSELDDSDDIQVAIQIILGALGYPIYN